MKTDKIAVAVLMLVAMVWLAGCASTQEPVAVDRGSKIDYVAICSAIDSSGGKVDKAEFCRFFKNKNLGAQTFETLDQKKKGYLTKEDVEMKQEHLDQVIRLTTPR